MISFKLNYLLKALSQNIVTWGLEPQYEFGGGGGRHKSVHSSHINISLENWGRRFKILLKNAQMIQSINKQK